jgi:hypothetical protein
MTKFHKLNSYPENTLVIRDLKSIDYFDSYMVVKETDEPIDKITERILTLPYWVKALLDIRYFLIVKPFGLQTGMKKQGHSVKNQDGHLYQNNFGEVSIINRNENEIVMGDDDKHLYYRISILKRNTGKLSEIYLTTIVKFNNNWGKVYFAFIKPFHKMVVKSMLRNLANLEK